MARARNESVVSASGKVEKLVRDSDGTVQSLLRAISLLEILAEDDEGYRLVDLAARAGLSTSTTHRLLTTLEHKQFVQFSRDASLWFVGVRCFSIGAAFARRRSFASLALPLMQRLRDQTGETVNLGLLDQGDIVFLTQVESREVMRAITRPGGRSPLPCTAMGQALLSAMSEEEVAEILKRYGLPRRTPNSIARPTMLHQVLAAARTHGYAVDDEENAVGLRCVAAVIFDEFRRPYAAISVAGPTVRVTARRVPELGAQAIAAARAITQATGGPSLSAHRDRCRGRNPRFPRGAHSKSLTLQALRGSSQLAGRFAGHHCRCLHYRHSQPRLVKRPSR